MTPSRLNISSERKRCQVRGMVESFCKGDIAFSWGRREEHCGLAPELGAGGDVRFGLERMESGGYFWKRQKHE